MGWATNKLGDSIAFMIPDPLPRALAGSGDHVGCFATGTCA